MQIIYRKMFVFSVFVCILKNTLKNILQCLEQRKMKKKKIIRNRNLTAANPPQTTVKQPTNPPSQQNPLHQNQKQTNQNPQIITIMGNIGSWRTSTSEREMVARARAHRFSSNPDLGRLRSQTGSRRLRSGDGSRVPPRRPRAHRLHQPPRQVRIWASASIWGGFSSPTAPPSSSLASSTTSSGPDLGRQRERELRKGRERES
jgi:hypothetical protein